MLIKILIDGRDARSARDGGFEMFRNISGISF